MFSKGQYGIFTTAWIKAGALWIVGSWSVKSWLYPLYMLQKVQEYVWNIRCLIYREFSTFTVCGWKKGKKEWRKKKGIRNRDIIKKKKREILGYFQVLKWEWISPGTLLPQLLMLSFIVAGGIKKQQTLMIVSLNTLNKMQVLS